MDFTPLIEHKIEDIATIIFGIYRNLAGNRIISKKNLLILCFIFQTESISTFKEVAFFDEFYYKNDRLYNKKVSKHYDFLMKHLNNKKYDYDKVDYGYDSFYLAYIIDVISDVLQTENSFDNALNFAKNITNAIKEESGDDSGRIDNEVLYGCIMNIRLSMEPDEVDETIDKATNKNLPYIENNIDVDESTCITEKIQ